MNPITITLEQIAAKRPCTSGWEKLLASKAGLPHDVPFPVTDILDSNGMDECLWSLRCLPAYDNLWRRYAVWCARQVQHLMTDPLSLAALDVADRHWQGHATDDELEAAREAAWAAWEAAWEALEAAGNAAANVAGNVAGKAAGKAAGEVAAEAAWAARSAAWEAAGVAVWPSAWDAARDAQSKQLRAILTAGEWVEGTP